MAALQAVSEGEEEEDQADSKLDQADSVVVVVEVINAITTDHQVVEGVVDLEVVEMIAIISECAIERYWMLGKYRVQVCN